MLRLVAMSPTGVAVVRSAELPSRIDGRDPILEPRVVGPEHHAAAALAEFSFRVGTCQPATRV